MRIEGQQAHIIALAWASLLDVIRFCDWLLVKTLTWHFAQSEMNETRIYLHRNPTEINKSTLTATTQQHWNIQDLNYKVFRCFNFWVEENRKHNFPKGTEAGLQPLPLKSTKILVQIQLIKNLRAEHDSTLKTVFLAQESWVLTQFDLYLSSPAAKNSWRQDNSKPGSAV